MLLKRPILRLKPIHLALIAALSATPTVGTLAAKTAIEDPNISIHIENELLFDPAVSFNRINVATTDGIVTLTGKVDNLLGKERAARIAATVRGVRSVINRLEVVPGLTISPSELINEIRRALSYDAVTESYEISISADNYGAVTLTGKVDSWEERTLAEKVVKRVAGVTQVNNELGVDTPDQRADTEIQAEIEKRMHWDILVDSELIRVMVDGGNVELSGTVGSLAEQQRAQWNAWVTGVESVDASNLKVARWAHDEQLRTQPFVERSTLEIREAIEDALNFDPRVSEFDLKVDVDAGMVTLRGTVDNLKARQAAIRDAKNTAGVLGVKSLIKVQPLTAIDDSLIKRKIKNALAINPITESYEIEVDVLNGRVRLSGSVDSYLEKGEAEHIAYMARGVIAVQNHLAVENPVVMVYDPYVDDWEIDQRNWYRIYPMPSTLTRTDWQIRHDIETELHWSPYVNRADIEIEVDSGVATLTGTVDSLHEYRAAERNAYQGGAHWVNNRLHIRLKGGEESLTDNR